MGRYSFMLETRACQGYRSCQAGICETLAPVFDSREVWETNTVAEEWCTTHRQVQGHGYRGMIQELSLYGILLNERQLVIGRQQK